MGRVKKLIKWIDTLSEKELKNILFDCVDELIDSEVVRFWDDSKAPYWDSCGDRLDEKELEE